MKVSAATQRFVDTVAGLQQREGLNWDTAWGEAARRNPALYAEMQGVNELPKGAQVSADGQRLTGDWPVPPAVLGALGLPMAATREQYQIYKAAERMVTVPPDMAAKIVVTLIRFQQLIGGSGFDDTWAALKRHFPDIFAAANKVATGTAANANPQTSNEAQHAINQRSANEAGRAGEVVEVIGPDVGIE